MYRYTSALILACFAHAAFADTNACQLAGTAYDASGKPLQAVVRLLDRQTRQTRFSVTDARAMFSFGDLSPDTSGQRYRLELLSPPTVVTGSRIPVRSILGIAPAVTCAAGQTARLDVHVQVD